MKNEFRKQADSISKLGVASLVGVPTHKGDGVDIQLGKQRDIPDVNFDDLDADEIKAEVFTLYTTITGRSVEKGDPIRLFILFIVDIIIRLLINRQAKNIKHLMDD